MKKIKIRPSGTRVGHRPPRFSPHPPRKRPHPPIHPLRRDGRPWDGRLDGWPTFPRPAPLGPLRRPVSSAAATLRRGRMERRLTLRPVGIPEKGARASDRAQIAQAAPQRNGGSGGPTLRPGRHPIVRPAQPPSGPGGLAAPRTCRRPLRADRGLRRPATRGL